MDVFTHELEKDFLDEAFSLTDSLESLLLALENNAKDDKAINELFRVAHTIKGGAGTVGFDEIQQLTHKMEDVMDLVRKEKLSVDADMITLLLQCRDEISSMLQARENGNEHKSETAAALIQALEKLKSGASLPATATVQKSIQVHETYTSDDISLMSEALVNKKNLYLLDFTLDTDYEMKEVAPFQIFSLLNDTGEIIKQNPDMETLENAFSEHLLFVISTDHDTDYIQKKVFLKEMIKDLVITPIDNKKISELENKNAQSQAGTEKQVKQASAIKTANNKTQERRNITTLRIESTKVDNLLNLLGELVITKATFNQLNLDFQNLQSEFKTLMKEFLSGIAKLSYQNGNLSEEESRETHQAFIRLFQITDMFSENMQKLSRISSSLQENVMNMRMVPIQMVFSRFPRLIRDLAGQLGKKIELVIEGVETEIDKGLVDDIFDPLIHLLRNAVDHGIETPEIRKKRNKPEVGKITLKATHEGDSIVVEVSDDGGGINPDRLKDKALSSGLLSEKQVATMSRRELLGLIFIPGLSTAKEVSNLSGRGVGMDVVKRKIEEIGGSISVATAIGKGSRFVIRLPLTLAIIQGLLILVEGMHYVIPVASVEETVIIKKSELKSINGHLAYEFRDKLIPILSLKTFFYHQKTDTNNEQKEYCIITKYGERAVGIVVSEVVGEQDVVIKALNTKLIKSPGISAATIVGSGEIGYILDTNQVISHYFKSLK